MDSGMISKIQKAKRYAEEPDRVEIRAITVHFRGEHDVYDITYEQGTWRCQCHFYQQRGLCSHTMAMERLLAPMLEEGRVQEV